MIPPPPLLIGRAFRLLTSLTLSRNKNNTATYKKIILNKFVLWPISVPFTTIMGCVLLVVLGLEVPEALGEGVVEDLEVGDGLVLVGGHSDKLGLL